MAVGGDVVDARVNTTGAERQIKSSPGRNSRLGRPLNALYG